MCKISQWKSDDAVTLDECPPGLFAFVRKNGEISIGFKSEYCSEVFNVPNIKTQPDAYCFTTGEYFWGDAHSVLERRELKVYPIKDMDAAEHSIVQNMRNAGLGQH